MRDKIYLVTGAAGHLGNTIVQQLVAEKKRVRIFILPKDHFPYNFPVETFRGDVTDLQTLGPFFQGLEDKDVYVIHCAAIVTIASKYQQKVYDVNVGGVKNILSMCQKYQVKKLVHVSSVHAIPEKKKGEIITEVDHFDPNLVEGLYAKTKAEASQLVLDACQKGLNATIVHPSGIIGPYDYGHGHLTQMIIDYMNHRLTAAVKGGYDFVDVRDTASLIIKALEKGRSGECYLCTNQYFEVQDILEKLHQITKRKRIKTILPIWFAKMTAPLAETYYKLLKQPPLYTAYSLYTLGTNAVFSHAKATEELGYHPRQIEETLKDTALWLEKQGRVKSFH